MRRLLPLLIVVAACSRSTTSGATSPSVPNGTPRVGPATGSVVVVGGGQQGPEIFARFIELAGGPDALIAEVPTAGGDSIEVANVGRGLRAAGARNVVVVHTTDRMVADADSFVARFANARGVWFGGGRHFRLVNSYMGTKSQRAFEAVLQRGGVVGGSSAGASILASYLIRGAPSNDNRMMNHPQYLTGFGYLRNTAIDQHVVARDRLADLHDSVTSKRPDLLAISEDEGTAWVVRGDTAVVIGRNKAFVYNGRDANDPGRPFLTLFPGDRYDLGARRLLARAASVNMNAIDKLFAAFATPAAGGAAVLVARDGAVLVNRAYGIPAQPRFTPETAVPHFVLGQLSAVLNAALTPDSTGVVGPAAVRRVQGIGGMQRAQYTAEDQQWRANVDDLYRFDQARFGGRASASNGLSVPAGFAEERAGGSVRHVAYGQSGMRQHAWVRFPDQRAVILVLTGSSTANARALADAVASEVLR